MKNEIEITEIELPAAEIQAEADKLVKETSEGSEDHLALWRQVQSTNKAFTKFVQFKNAKTGKMSRGFITIDASYQILKATKQWGPMGNWGLKDMRWSEIVEKGIREIILDAVFFYPCEARNVVKPDGGRPINEFEVSTCMKYVSGNDTRKKMQTDLTTKALSKLGFNADVFLGLHDDQKYAKSRREVIEAVVSPKSDEMNQEIFQPKGGKDGEVQGNTN